MLENKDSLWNSAELYDIYISCSSRLLSGPKVIEKVEKRLSDDVIVFTYTAGCASSIPLKRCASSVLRIVKDKSEEDELEHGKIKVAICILNVRESK